MPSIQVARSERRGKDRVWNDPCNLRVLRPGRGTLDLGKGNESVMFGCITTKRYFAVDVGRRMEDLGNRWSSVGADQTGRYHLTLANEYDEAANRPWFPLLAGPPPFDGFRNVRFLAEWGVEAVMEAMPFVGMFALRTTEHDVGPSLDLPADPRDHKYRMRGRGTNRLDRLRPERRRCDPSGYIRDARGSPPPRCGGRWVQRGRNDSGLSRDRSSLVRSW